MLGELRDDNQRLTSILREVHNVCDGYGDVATASLVENWIDETERRTWFLFEIDPQRPRGERLTEAGARRFTINRLRPPRANSPRPRRREPARARPSRRSELHPIVTTTRRTTVSAPSPSIGRRSRGGDGGGCRTISPGAHVSQITPRAGRRLRHCERGEAIQSRCRATGVGCFVRRPHNDAFTLARRTASWSP